MRSRVLGTVLIAGLIAFAGPAWSESKGGGHSGSGHSSGGGPAAHPHGSAHVGHTHHWGGHFGWRGFYGWGGLYLGLPLLWDAYWGWGWPYGYYPPYAYYGYPNSGIAFVPPDSAAAEPGSGETGTAVLGPSPVDIEVSPQTALVYLNGVLIGSAEEFGGHPDYLYLDPGQYTVDLKMPGYRSKSLKLNVGGENKVVLSLDLQVDPAAGAEPANPPSPGLPFGRRFGPSFGPTAVQARPSPGDSGTVQSPTAAGSAFTALELRVSPPGAAVYLDGVFLGTGDNLARLQQGLVVSPGPHRIDVVAPGHAGKTIQVSAEAGKKQELSIALD